MSRETCRRAATHAVALAGVLLALAAVPTVASAFTLESFKHCPKENPELQVESAACVYSKSVYNASKWAQPEPPSQLQAGNVIIPFKKPLLLQGGFLGIVEGTIPLVPPEDGTPAIMPTPEPVPGGLASEIDPSKLHGATLQAYEEAIHHHQTKVTATIESAGPAMLTPDSLLAAEGTFLTLRLKVKFSNPVLGEGCYSGSDAEPVVTELTDGTTSPPPPNEPISGQLGALKFVKKVVIAIKEDSLVGNSFEAPAVHGCGAEPAWQEEVDEAINSKAGLPSPAGHNSTRINGSQFLAGIETLRGLGF
jgi:hypothetical protein